MLVLEARKLVQYRTAAGVLLLYVVLFFLYVLEGYKLNQPVGQAPELTYAFPVLWGRLASTGSLFSLLLVILFLILTTDDFQYRIFRQQLIDGASYGKLLQIKFFDALLLVVFALLTTGVIGLFYALRYGANPVPMATSLLPVVFGAVQLVGFLSFALFIGVLVRKNGMATLLFFLYIFLVEPLVRNRVPRNLASLLPSNILFTLTPSPAVGITQLNMQAPLSVLPFALAYIGLFWAAAYLLLRKQDL
ncbi:hypothetical protein [Hymenobacter metallicola]|uniref:Uncharacterized protein n=1 Tax=Hymenobacter metallicola TaxID=2563114 RepID=A0A4Z0QBF6_9BACT|nr:hypothetical protein [Hymenobacter metallicola]TGE27418.1 hypothetical protein E5K02_13645 [Hymenobacter metallicola]